MASVKFRNRKISYDGKMYETTIGGRRVADVSLQSLKAKIRQFEADKGRRKGKSILAKYRG